MGYSKNERIVTRIILAALIGATIALLFGRERPSDSAALPTPEAPIDFRNTADNPCFYGGEITLRDLVASQIYVSGATPTSAEQNERNWAMQSYRAADSFLYARREIRKK